MPEKPTTPATTRQTSTPVKGVRLRRCRSCGDLELSSRLSHGQCPDCIGLQTLPLRGAGGRFMSFTPTTPATSGRSVEGGEGAA